MVQANVKGELFHWHMGASAKAKANGMANLKSSTGKAKLKGKVKPEGKAHVKGKADDQDQAQPQYLVSASGVGSKGSNGWNCIQPGQPLGKLGSQYLKYHLQGLVESDPEKKNKQKKTKTKTLPQ